MDQGNALGLGGEEIVILLRGNQLQQVAGAGDGQLRVAKADKSADVQIVGDLAKGQFALETRDLHGISQH